MASQVTDVLACLKSSESRSGNNLPGQGAIKAKKAGVLSGAKGCVHEEKDGIQSGRNKGENETEEDSGNESSDGKVDTAKGERERDLVELQTETLAAFIIDTLLGNRNGEQTKCAVERTLLRCVKTMLQEHEILLKGMMERFNISKGIYYDEFVILAFDLFDGGKGITWAKIIAFYTFGARLALYCKEKNMEDYCCDVTEHLGKCASEFVAPYVKKSGGWTKICDVFPSEDDSEDKPWQFLIWAVLGFGLVVLASFLTRHF